VLIRLTRTRRLALALPALCGALLCLLASRGTAQLLALRPGPIDHPLYILGADFNQDGYDDLVVANFEAGTVTVLINQRNGTFQLQKDSPNIVGGATVTDPTLGPLFLATADLNPEDIDGDRVNNDVDTCPSVYNPEDSTGVQAACPTIDPLLDSDGDGVPDITDNCPMTPNPGQEPETAAGLDGVCGTADDNTFLVPVGATCGTQQTTKVGAACSRSNDLIVVNSTSGLGSATGLIRVRVNDTTGGLLDRFSVLPGVGSSEAVLADFNGDLRPDLVESNAGSDTLIYFPTAIGGDLGAVCLLGSNPGASCVTAADCPGGTCQSTTILFAGGLCIGGSAAGAGCATNDNCPGGGVCLPSPAPGADATCSGGFVPGKTCTRDADCPGGGRCRTPEGPEGLAAADFDGDGTADLAYADRIAGNVGILLNPGKKAAFVPATGSPFAVPNQPSFLLAAKLDGDACADLIVLRQGSRSCLGGTIPGASCLIDPECTGGGTCTVPGNHGEIDVYLTNCPQGTLPPTPLQTIDLGVGHVPRNGKLVDLDGDGVLDLAVADFSGGQVLLYHGAGGGTFTPAGSLTGLASPSAIAPLDYDRDGRIDLAVLGFGDNRIELYRNTGSPGTVSFTVAPTSPVSPWSGVSGMAVFPFDASVGQDVALLNVVPPRLDVLSGTGSTFRGLPPLPLKEPARATGMAVGDLKQDGLVDLVVLDDATQGTLTPLISDPTGVQIERPKHAAGNGPVSATIAPLSLHPGDYDQDGVPDAVDDCPTMYNPPNCPSNDPVNFPECFLANVCLDKDTLTGVLFAPTDCSNKDPNTHQCDSDLNGVGDRCQILDSTCQNIDSDLDLVPDYDRFATPPKLDNCPWIANSDQADADSNHIGDSCDNSTCLFTGTAVGTCGGGPKLNAACRTDTDCETPVNDAVIVDGAGGSVSFFVGDAAGGLAPAPVTWSAIGGLSNPFGAVVDRFGYTCTGPVCLGGTNPGTPCEAPGDCLGLGFCPQIPFTCIAQPEPGVMVAERGSPGSGDDSLDLFLGDGSGGFSAPAPPVAARVPLQGDPTRLLISPDQGVCGTPWLNDRDSRFHFDVDNKASVIAAVEPGTSSVDILLPSNEGPVRPPGNPNPLVQGSPPVDAAFADMNRDGIEDLVVLSSGDGNPATPNVTIYIGVGNGLFFTDPTINPTDVPDGMTRLATGQVNLLVDSTYPDVVLFDSVAQAPVIMTNTILDRVDIDRSGRVDGYDLALLARSFGAVRGEDFTIQADGTLLQSPDLVSTPAYTPSRVVVGGGVLKEGMDLPAPYGPGVSLVCTGVLDPLTGLYGLPVDINLDGSVDGTDLALLASRFGQRIP